MKQRRSYASHRRPWPWYLYRRWRFNEVACDEDRFWLLRCTTTAADRPPVCLQTGVPVTSSIARSDTAGPRQCHSCRNTTVPAEAAPVGDEPGCPAGVFFIEVRPHHSAPPSAALAQDGAANWLQACCPCIQVLTWSSTVVPCWWTLSVSGFQRVTSPSFSIVIITSCPPYASVNRRRQNFPRRRRSCVERSTTARQIRPSLSAFHSGLKTHLFQRCFPSLLCVVPEQWLVISDTLIARVIIIIFYFKKFTI